MKNSSMESMWSLMWLISLLWMLWLLLSVSVFAADTVTIDIDPSSAVQHIDSVRIMQEGNTGDDAIITSEWAWLLKIQTNSNILLGIDNEITDNGTNSTILGWINNSIVWWQDSTIIAWASNSIEWWKSNTILGWQANLIWWESSFSTIAGGLHNSIVWILSTIVWWKNNHIEWDFSAIVWEENVVVWNNSVAAWKNSTVNANNSFLWTDSANNWELNANDVFAVVSRKWMVINASTPNQYAQLTIWWPLVVSMNDNDENAICGWGQWGWIMRTIKAEDRYCLCSCDWSGRNSMFWQWQCQAICHGEAMQPACGTRVERIHCNDVYTFRWSCEGGYPVDGTWAYLVDKNDMVHWTCQTSDWAFTGCSLPATEITPIPNCPANCEDTPWWTILDWESVQAYSSNSPTWTCDVIIRKCNAGILEGDSSYNLPSCANWCKKPWNNEYISDWSVLTAYEQNVVPHGSSCVSHERKCINGSLTEEWIYKDCIEHDETNCIHNGLEYPHWKTIVTYEQVSYQCPDWCKEHSSEARCYNGKWLKTDSENWVSDTELKPGVDPDTIRANLYYYPRCDSTNSFNATTYTLLMCPSKWTCSTGTVSLGGENPNNGCSTNTMNKLEYCAAGYYNSGNVTCVQCPTWYSSNTWASLNGCIIKCDDAEYLPDVGGDSCKSCPVWTYITWHTVNYWNKSSCYPCDNGPAHSVYTTNGTWNNCGWTCAAGYHREGNECKWAGMQFSDLEMYFVTDEWNTWYYVMMDRNLWATAYMNQPWKTSGERYGYLYQWWNNYWFPNNGVITKTSSEKVDASLYWPGRYYSSDTFILDDDSKGWLMEQNENLWWWNGSEDDRQWPCPERYHIPKNDEFVNLMQIWRKSTNSFWSRSSDTLMPQAGMRLALWVRGQDVWGYYWSSSSELDYYVSGLHFATSPGVDGNSPNSRWESVRCFKNSPTPSLTLHPNEWKKAIVIVHNKKITKLWEPTRDWKAFWWWYWDSGYTSKAKIWDRIEASSHLYAKWN